MAVKVEADISDGMPQFDMVGLLSNKVKEARERVKTAFRNSGYKLPAKKITVNLTPANLRESGNSCDFPIAAVLLASFVFVDENLLSDFILLGEIGLDGSILPVEGALPAAILAKELGCKGILLPKENACEAAAIKDLAIIPIDSLRHFVSLCQDALPKSTYYHRVILAASGIDESTTSDSEGIDFAEVSGQILLRRAAEISVAGRHNLLIVGPPGSGKTMVAKRMPSIMPKAEEKELLEVSRIYSIAGLLGQNDGLIKARPFRSPHHTITSQALTGGGYHPKPGEISLAHKGV